MDVDELKEDVRSGRISTDRLCELLCQLQKRCDELERQLDELKKQLGGSPAPKLDQSYSVGAEERRQEASGKKPRKRKKRGRRGRKASSDKLAQAERTEKVFPEGCLPENCQLSHARPVWRLEQGRAVLVAYEVYRCGNRYGQISGALGRSEFGLEIVVAIAYQVYVLGLSFEKVCAVMGFFQNLPLKKSQVDALLFRLACCWEGEFDILCTLLANSAVVHTDETGWSLNSVWAFLSEKVRVLFFGVHKDAATLGKILNPETFGGIVISDDASVYANFTHAQKCWAHLLRKAIKLTLLAPDHAEYRAFTDRLLEIYREACRIQGDRRLSDAGRKQRVAALDDEILALCGTRWCDESRTPGDVEDDYRRLTNEIMRLMLARELFTFVTAAPVNGCHGPQRVAGTNNEAERTLRNPAQARDTGRTSKTPKGARRQTIVHSMLESLRTVLPKYTLATVVAEVLRWTQAGRSCFAKMAAKMRLKPPQTSILDHVLPTPSG
jgi:hypothetical protein